MTSRLARIGAYFFEPAAPVPDREPDRGGTRGAPARTAGGSGPPEHEPGWTRAAVLGVHAAVVPVAAACAGELRARERAPAAVLCLWRPAGAAPHALDLGALPPADEAGPRPPADETAETGARGPAAEPGLRPPAGATTPGARRLATRLAGHELAASACGRLAWIVLDPDPATALDQARRCVDAAPAPVVLAVAGPRPAAFEPLLAALDLALAVLPADADPSLRALALDTLAARERHVVPPLPPGPPRWAAMAGLARLRSLPHAGSAVAP